MVWKDQVGIVAKYDPADNTVHEFYECSITSAARVDVFAAGRRTEYRRWT